MSDTNTTLTAEDKRLLDQFLNDNQLFYAPDPEIMASHSISPRSAEEERVLSQGVDPHRLNQVRGIVIAALDESFTMVEQMGAAPGAKWGDLVTGIYTATGDLSMIAPHGIVAFAGCCHYPIKFIRKYWENDPTVGLREGDGFIHNDSRYGGIHNTDQSMIMPVYWQGELICWISSTVHEGENGACEPGGMPAAAESKFDEGLKMSPFRLVENFEVRRDLLTFLQNSVRDPKLQLEDVKVKLHAVMRLRDRVLRVLEEHGKDALIAALRKNLEDVEVEVRRRIAELPDGTTRVVSFPDSTLRENALLKFNLAVTVKGDRMILDLRGSSPEFLNRSINCNFASFRTILLTAYLQNIWPDLPHTMAVFSPIEVIADENSLVCSSFDTPQAMSLIPLFKGMTLPVIPMAKLSYSLPHRYTAIVAPQYDQPATFIYGGLTQHGESVGNFCADINGNGQGARSHRDGENALSPPFGFMCDIGEQELAEEELPILRLGGHNIATDRVGFGKFRGGFGYEQVATVRGSNLWGFMTGCTGSVFSPSPGMFGGYASPVYALCKIRGINVFDFVKQNPGKIEFDILKLMNEQPIPDAKYSTHDLGMTFELVNEGEIYMICQGGGAGYGDVLERDPALVIKDVEEGLVSRETAQDLFKVAFDPENLLLDAEGTRKVRDAERRARIARGKPYHEFVKEWQTAEPPAHIPYFGSWDDPKRIWAMNGGQRVVLDADKLTGMFMPNPKDVRIGALEAEVLALRAQLESANAG